jgi:hypothetical protein
MYEPEERRRQLSGLILPLAALVIVGVAIAAVVLGLGLLDGDDDSDSDTTAEASPAAGIGPTPAGANPAEVAIGEFVSTRLGASYAGDCSQATVSQQPPTGATGAPAAPAADALCSQSRGEREQVQAYVLGRPLEEPTQWVFVEQSGASSAVTYAPPITAELQAVGGVPWPLRPGVEVVVTGADPCLNVREGPALNQAAIDCVGNGTTVVVGAGPAEADGYQWWQIEGRAGWVVSAYLRYADAQ